MRYGSLSLEMSPEAAQVLQTEDYFIERHRTIPLDSPGMSMANLPGKGGTSKDRQDSFGAQTCAKCTDGLIFPAGVSGNSSSTLELAVGIAAPAKAHLLLFCLPGGLLVATLKQVSIFSHAGGVVRTGRKPLCR